MKRFAIGMLGIAAAIGWADIASAQSRTGTTSSLGGTNAFGSSAGTSAAAASMLGGMTGGSMGGTGTATQTLGGTPQITRNSNFVGSSAADAVNIFGLTSAINGGGGMTGMGGMSRGMSGMGMGGMGGMGGRGNTMGMSGLQQQQDTSKMVRATVKLGFTFPQPLDSTRAQTIQARLVQLPLPDRIQNVRVSLSDRQATLQGAVETESDKMLIERLVKLEPGVSTVNNELKVASATSTNP